MLAGWSRETVAGKRADVFDPTVRRSRVAVLFLHDLDEGSPADDPAVTDTLAQLGIGCVAPWGGRSWWLDRVCPEFDAELTPERHLIENVLPWMCERWGLGPRAVAAVGVGMGGQGAVRLGFRQPDRFPVVASLAGHFDFHDWYGRGTPLDEMFASRERARQATAILHVEPARYPPHVWFACDPADDRYRGNDRLHEKLRAYGIPHAADLNEHTAQVGSMIAFAADAIEREQLRLM